MPRHSTHFDPTKTQKLAELRAAAGVSQQKAAKFFGLKDRGPIHSWEVGYSSPLPKYRAAFIVYLLDRLKLRSDLQSFDTLWDDLVVKTWGWEPLNLDERQNYLPHVNTNPSIRQVPFLAPPKIGNLIGRDGLLYDLKRRLFALENMVLCGLPGVGKTTLAIELANDRTVLAAFSEGVLWARLGCRANVLEELSKWAIALGVSLTELSGLSSTEALVETVHKAIGLRRMLLVVDDAWTSEVALNFLIGGPNCVRLITTRLPEVVAQLGDRTVMIVVEELQENDGVLLLEKLASNVIKGEPEAATKLVKAVGGLPLALILMGNYLRIQTYGKLDHQIRSLLDSLTGMNQRLNISEVQAPLHRHPSLAPGTSVSLQTVINVSYEILPTAAQVTLRALSLFPPKPNTFSKEAASTVAATSSAELLTLLGTGLIERSEENRCTIHQTIADVMKVQRLEASVYKRFIAYFVEYAQIHLTNYSAIETEFTNILAALELAHTQQMYELFIQGVNAVYQYTETRGLYSVIELLLQQAYDVATTASDTIDKVRILFNLSTVATQRGNYSQAEAFSREGLALAQTTEQHELALEQIRNLAQILKHRGVFDKSQSLLQDGLKLARSYECQPIVAAYLNDVGVLHRFQGNYENARAAFQEGLALARSLALPERACGLLSNLATIALDQGKDDEAKTYLAEGLKLAEKAGHQLLRCILLSNEGLLAQNHKDFAQAAQSLEEGLRLAETLDHKELISTLSRQLGTLALERRLFEQAEKYFERAFKTAENLNHLMRMCEALIEWGQLPLEQAKWGNAADVFQRAHSLAQQIAFPTYIAESLFGLAQSALGQGRLHTATKLGQESFAIYHKLKHGRAADVANWLATLPLTD